MKAAFIKLFRQTKTKQSFLVRSAKSKAGFTLIELLVVIGILGILAAALVATIDPFEQLKKADDANTKNTMVEFLTANIRYYTTHSEFPWQSTDALYATCSGIDTSGTFDYLQLSDGASTNTAMENCIDALVGDKELKLAFSTSNALPKIYITYNANKELVGCFQPESKSQQNDDNTKYNRNGVENVTKACTVTTGGGALTNGCYWCTR